MVHRYVAGTLGILIVILAVMGGDQSAHGIATTYRHAVFISCRAYFSGGTGHVDGDIEIITVSRDRPFIRWHGDCRITQLVILRDISVEWPQPP